VKISSEVSYNIKLREINKKMSKKYEVAQATDLLKISEECIKMSLKKGV